MRPWSKLVAYLRKGEVAPPLRVADAEDIFAGQHHGGRLASYTTDSNTLTPRLAPVNTVHQYSAGIWYEN